MREFPMHVNGWEYSLNYDSMLYYKPTLEGWKLIDMTWLDLTKGDEGYKRDANYVVCMVELDDNQNLEEAMQEFDEWYHTDGFCISEMLTRDEAENFILEYMKNH